MTGPVDIVAVQHDDMLLDRLGSAVGLRPSDDEVAALLDAWRADLADEELVLVERPVLEPLPPVELPPAVSGRRYTRALVVGAVLAGVIGSAGGVAAAAAQATPGSVLWPVTKVVAPGHAQHAEAREYTDAALGIARRLRTQGDTKGAMKTLLTALQQARAAHADDLATQLQKEIAALSPAEAPTAGLPTTSPAPQASASPPAPSASPTDAAPSLEPSTTPTPSPTADAVAPSPAVSASPTPGATTAAAGNPPTGSTGKKKRR